MTLTIKVSQSLEDVNEYGKIGLENKLHFKGGATASSIYSFLNWITDIKTSTQILIRAGFIYHWTHNQEQFERQSFIISLAYTQKECVGILVIKYRDIHFYVKPAYRQQGIARQLFLKTSEYHNLTMKIINYGHSIRAKRVMGKLGIEIEREYR